MISANASCRYLSLGITAGLAGFIALHPSLSLGQEARPNPTARQMITDAAVARIAAESRGTLREPSIEAAPRSSTLQPTPFPSLRMIPDRSSPSRVRSAASRPGPLRADPGRRAVYEGKKGGLAGPEGNLSAIPARWLSEVLVPGFIPSRDGLALLHGSGRKRNGPFPKP